VLIFWSLYESCDVFLCFFFLFPVEKIKRRKRQMAKKKITDAIFPSPLIKLWFLVFGILWGGVIN
jgi:Na+/H+ antiporter NhaD/arsenite permease-like protein